MKKIIKNIGILTPKVPVDSKKFFLAYTLKSILTVFVLVLLSAMLMYNMNLTRETSDELKEVKEYLKRLSNEDNDSNVDDQDNGGSFAPPEYDFQPTYGEGFTETGFSSSAGVEGDFAVVNMQFNNYTALQGPAVVIKLRNEDGVEVGKTADLEIDTGDYTFRIDVQIDISNATYEGLEMQLFEVTADNNGNRVETFVSSHAVDTGIRY